ETKSLIDDRLQLLVGRQTQQKLQRIESYDAIVKDLEQLKDGLHRSSRESLEQLCIDALARIDSEYKTLKAEQSEKGVVAGIEALRVGEARLADCRKMSASVQQTLEETLAAASDKARQRVTAIQQQLNRRIASCEEWIDGLPGRVSSATDAAQLSALRDEIIKCMAVYTDTPEEESLLVCKEQVETKAAELAAAEQQRTLRQTQIAAHFRLVNERADRVAQAHAFADAVREFAGLQPLPALPDGISLTAEEKSEQQVHLDRARQRVVALFNELTAANTPQTPVGFEHRRTLLAQAIGTLNTASGLPPEWPQQLRNLAESNRRTEEDWKAEQRAQEEAERLARENERRRASNRTLVEGVLKQAQIAKSLREIQNAVALLNDVRARLELPCDEDSAQIEQALRELSKREETIRGWVNEVLPERLSAAWVISEVNELRQKLADYTSRCEGDAALTAILNQARLRLDERGMLLHELPALGKNVTSISHGLERLARLEVLRETYPDCGRLVTEVDARLREKLAQLQAEQRAEAENWLAQFNVALERELLAEGAGTDQRQLEFRSTTIRIPVL
ncbi:hypothetical protein, partial [Shinella sp.]|uniref:hypothetical protein n=1 Tax=Shinella sp. TaxID=1870904 RepID=UPI00258FC1AA